MTPQEFKAWFEGFTEAFDRIPTKAQWARVKERVAEIDGKPVTERIYLDRYWNYPRPHWDIYPRYATFNTSAVGMTTNTVTTPCTTHQAQNFNSGSAMLALGRADAQALAV